MNYLLDTCVISELVKIQGDENVLDWIKNTGESGLFLSVLTIGEIHKGIAKLPDSKRKLELRIWVDNDLKKRFKGRIIDITQEIAIKWGDIQGEAEKIGKKMPVLDSLLAATALVNNFTLVTRNVRNVETSGCDVLNLWEPEN